MPQKCTSTTAKGKPCRAWAIPGTQPARCSAHKPSAGHGAPTGNRNAETHGAYAKSKPPADLDAAIADLQRRLVQVSSYIDIKIMNNVDADTFIKLASLQGTLTSRLGRLMRDRATTGEGFDSDINSAVNLVLDQLSDELGIEL